MVFDLNTLKKFMQDKGWSELQLAKAMSLDYSYIYRVMRGQRGVGKKFYDNLFKLCHAENLPVDYFFKNEEWVDETNSTSQE